MLWCCAPALTALHALSISSQSPSVSILASVGSMLSPVHAIRSSHIHTVLVCSSASLSCASPKAKPAPQALGAAARRLGGTPRSGSWVGGLWVWDPGCVIYTTRARVGRRQRPFGPGVWAPLPAGQPEHVMERCSTQHHTPHTTGTHEIVLCSVSGLCVHA